MAAVENWYSQPVFISSTFTDMMAERDHLRDFVFPELAERMRERKYYLEPVDLRWGVETITLERQPEKELLVLKVCLDEIERCKPFFIAIIGDRYGWIPPENRMKAAVLEKGFKTSTAGKSVTALEIEFGVLASRDQQKRSHFYFRNPLPYHEMPHELAVLYSDEFNPEPWAPDAVIHLRHLKEDIKKRIGKERAKNYSADWDRIQSRVTGLEQWGMQVLEDLWTDLDEQTRTTVSLPAVTWQEQERLYLNDFIEERARGFEGRQNILKHLVNFALSHSKSEYWGTCVIAGSGSGKSALFARLVLELNKKDCLLLTHAAGISLRSSGVDALLRRWIQELSVHLKVPDGDPSKDLQTLEEKKKLFAGLLSRAAVKNRVICVVDALDQMERTPAMRHMTWLPDSWPENARLICTALPVEETRILAGRNGVECLRLEALTEKEAGEIIQSICRRYHKSIHRDVVESLISKRDSAGIPACSNPLWLSLAVEELLLVDEDDFTRMRTYAGTPEQQLHAMILEITEGIPGSVEDLYVHLIRRADKRFSEKWLRNLLHFMAESRQGLRKEDLMAVLPKRTNENWDDLRFAAFRHYFRAHLVQRGEQGLWDFTHNQLRISLSRELGKGRADFQNIHTILADHFISLNVSDPLHETETMFHLMQADEKKKAACYLSKSDLTNNEKTGAARILAEIIITTQDQSVSGLTKAADLLTQECLDDTQLEKICERYQFDLLNMLSDDTYITTRIQFMQAVRNAALVLYSRSPRSALYIRNLSVSCSFLGDLYLKSGEPAKAFPLFQDCVRFREILYKGAPGLSEIARDLSKAYSSIGDIYTEHGNLHDAVEHYSKCLKIREELYQRKPESVDCARDLLVSYGKLGDSYLFMGNPQAALPFYENILKLAEKLNKENPGSPELENDLSITYGKLGEIYRKLDWPQKALYDYQESIKLAEALCLRVPDSADYQRNLSMFYNNIGHLYVDSGDYETALKNFENCRKIRQVLQSRDPGSAQYTRDLSVVHNNLGDAYLRLGRFKDAMTHYLDSLKIVESMFRKAPDSAEFARDLWGVYYRIAVVNEQMDNKSALEWYRKSYEVVNRLKTAGIFISPQDEQIYNVIRQKVMG